MIDRHRDVYGINEEVANQILLKYKPSQKEEDSLKKRLEKLEKKHAAAEQTGATFRLSARSNNSEFFMKTLSPSAVNSTLAYEQNSFKNF